MGWGRAVSFRRCPTGYSEWKIFGIGPRRLITKEKMEAQLEFERAERSKGLVKAVEEESKKVAKELKTIST